MLSCFHPIPERHEQTDVSLLTRDNNESLFAFRT